MRARFFAAFFFGDFLALSERWVCSSGGSNIQGRPTAIDDNEQLSYERIFLADVEPLKEQPTFLVADTFNKFKALTPQHHLGRKASRPRKILCVRGSPKIQRKIAPALITSECLIDFVEPSLCQFSGFDHCPWAPPCCPKRPSACLLQPKAIPDFRPNTLHAFFPEGQDQEVCRPNQDRHQT
jgi:hypothetical protein